MIAELRLDLIKPRMLPQAAERLRHALNGVVGASPLGGAWRTDAGTIDQLVTLWTYADVSARERFGDELAAGSALRGYDELVMRQHIRLVKPAPFSAPIGPRQLGKLYEVRIYNYEPGAIPNVIERWAEKIEKRIELSPLVFCGHSLTGRLNQWIHVWAYGDPAERLRVRAKSIELGIWPPDARAGLIKQRNMLLMPMPFSPLQ